MSATLIVAIPLALLGVVALLGFVGCILPKSGLPPDFTTYSDTTVLGNPNCVAYWPLWESNNTMPAVDRKGGRNGRYIDPNTAPAGLYPWPQVSVPNPPGPDVLSAAAPGTLMQGQQAPGIVNGDFIQPANTTQASCMVVNGAFVKVDAPDKAAINPPSFTIEAWVRVDWTSDDPFAWRGVIDSRDAGTGFGLHARTDDNLPGVYHWEAVVGIDAASGTFAPLASPDPIPLAQDVETPATPTHLAVTYDATSQLLILFINGQESRKIMTPYVPNTTQPLVIGAQAAFIPQRPQPPGVTAGPLGPYVGAIQDVAIYDAALDGDTIKLHFDNGQGNKT